MARPTKFGSPSSAVASPTGDGGIAGSIPGPAKVQVPRLGLGLKSRVDMSVISVLVSTVEGGQVPEWGLCQKSIST